MNHGADVGSLCLFLIEEEKKKKPSSLANMRLQPERDEVIGIPRFPKTENFEILVKLLPSCFSVIDSLTFFPPKTSLLTEHKMISPVFIHRCMFHTHVSVTERPASILPLRPNLEAAINNSSIWE